MNFNYKLDNDVLFVSLVGRLDTEASAKFDTEIAEITQMCIEVMLEDFADIYHVLDPKDKFFYPFLQIEAVSEEIDILCEKGEDISDFEFLKWQYKRFFLRIVFGNRNDK